MKDDIDILVAAHKRNRQSAPSHKIQQWHDAIDAAAEFERSRETASQRRSQPTSFFWGMAVSAALAIGIGIGFALSERHGSIADIPVRLADAEPARRDVVPAAFTRGLQVHLQDSRRQLTSVSNDADTAILVLRIIEQNRLFESAAENNNAHDLARVLRAFEPVLLRLASGNVAPQDAAELRAQLAFELNVMLTKLAREASDKTHST